MFNAACKGFEAQADMMVRYIVEFGLVDELQRHDFRGFARGYNGKNYAEGGYHTKLQEAYEAACGKKTSSAADGMLRLGSEGNSVRELQNLLVRAGFAVNADGDFGPATKKALQEFQRSKSIQVDGVAGPETMKALSEYRQTGENLAKPDLKGVVDGLVVAVGGPVGVETARKAVEEAAKQVVGYGLPSLVSTGLLWIAGILVVIGLGLSAYKFWKATRA
jgi:hypothetical protein